MFLNSFRDKIGYWGPVTSSIDWCEPNYIMSPYVAEFWNSISSLSISLGGIVGMYLTYRYRSDPQLFWYCVQLTMVGIGSALYHGTLLFHTQMLDELPMIYCISTCVHIWLHAKRTIAGKANYERYGRPEAGCQWFETVPMLRPFTNFALALQKAPVVGFIFRNRTLAIVMANVVFSIAHCIFKFTVLFQLLFASLLWFSLFMNLNFLKHFKKNKVAVGLFKLHLVLYFVLCLLAFAFWITDNVMCETLLDMPVYPQFHAIWHVLSGFATYLVFVYASLTIYMLETLEVYPATDKEPAVPAIDSEGKLNEDLQFKCGVPVVKYLKVNGVPLPYHYIASKYDTIA